MNTGQSERSNIFIGQTKQIQKLVFATDQKYCIGQTQDATKIFFRPLRWVHWNPFPFSLEFTLAKNSSGLRTSSQVAMDFHMLIDILKTQRASQCMSIGQKAGNLENLLQNSTTGTCTGNQPEKESSQISSNVRFD